MGFSIPLLCFLCSSFADLVPALPGDTEISTSGFNRRSKVILSIFKRLYLRVLKGEIETWEMVLFSSVPLLLFWLAQRMGQSSASQFLASADDRERKGQEMSGDLDAEVEAPESGLLKKHSKLRTFTTSRYTYAKLRVFFRPHPQFDKLPTDPAPLPLLVFIHGLGGSVAQFHLLLTSLVNVASSLAIDLPGCGLSAFEQKRWDAYKIENLAELLSVIIEQHRVPGQSVVLIGHSLGCSLAALIASKTHALPNSIAEHINGIVAICPRAEPPTEKEVAMFSKLLFVPGTIFDIWRRWDRRGGKDSASVQRFVGEDADEATKLLQYQFNNQSKTPVWRRMASGTLPDYENGVASGGIPGRDIWSGLRVPMFLVAGEADHITKPDNVEKIVSFLGKGAAVKDERVNSSQLTHPKKSLKTTILPKPASHAMLYQPAFVHILAGLIFDFLSKQISPRLDLGWQLQYLSSSGKWDVKNLEKWQAVKPVSQPIRHIFRAMKTLREVDPTHSPLVFAKDWGNQIKDIVDISHESPVYDPRNFEQSNITYHKFPTVSKIPPTPADVANFISLIDTIRDSQASRRESEGWGEEEVYIGVHCHYGFNRTGFFIVSYLTERCGFKIEDAIEEFRVRRPNGIRHAHFLNELSVRYCRGLKRAPTL